MILLTATPPHMSKQLNGSLMHNLLSTVLGLLAVAIASAGCQGSRMASSQEASTPLTDSTLTEINEALRERSAIIDLTNGRTVRGYDVEMDHDSTYWIDPYTHSEVRQSVATGEVQHVAVYKDQSHWVGRLLGGAAVAAILLARSDFFTGYFVSTGAKVFTGALFGGLISRYVSRDTRVIYRARSKTPISNTPGLDICKHPGELLQVLSCPAPNDKTHRGGMGSPEERELCCCSSPAATNLENDDTGDIWRDPLRTDCGGLPRASDQTRG